MTNNINITRINNQKNEGLTLAELIISVAIMLVISAFGINFITGFESKQDLNSASVEIISAVKRARSIAVSQQEPAGLVGSMSVVRLGNRTSGAERYIYAYANNDTNRKYFETKYDSKGKISWSATPSELIFTAYEGKLASSVTGTPLPFDQNITIVVSASDTGNTRAFVVSSSGSIREL